MINKIIKNSVLLMLLLSRGLIAADESYEKAQHRLPPVIYSIDSLPKVIKSDHTYSAKWSVMGYHDTYDITIQVKDKNNLLFTKKLSPVKEEEGQYRYGDIYSKRFHYSTTFKISFTETQPITVRFFASPVKDPYDSTPLSVIIPGGSGYTAGDTSGRTLHLKGIATDGEALWNLLVENARIGDILLFAPESDRDPFSNAEYYGVPYGFFSHAALVYKKSGNEITVLHAASPSAGIITGVYDYDTLKNRRYYQSISLVRAKDVSNLWAKKVMKDGYDDFYGGSYWVTYCSELIEKVYDGVQDFSDGGTLLGVFTPDSIAASENVDFINTATF